MKRISISVRCTVLMLVFSLLFSLSASAQQGKVNVDVKNVSLKEFFNVIEQQTDYRFSYRDSELEGKPSVTVKVTNADLASLLVSELSKADLRYTLVNDKIVVTPQPKESPEVKAKAMNACFKPHCQPKRQKQYQSEARHSQRERHSDPTVGSWCVFVHSCLLCPFLDTIISQTALYFNNIFSKDQCKHSRAPD